MFHRRCLDEIAFLRAQVTALQERNDRLTEALAQKTGVDLILPRPAPVALEPSPGWWDTKPFTKEAVQK